MTATGPNKGGKMIERQHYKDLLARMKRVERRLMKARRIMDAMKLHFRWKRVMVMRGKR
jgi:hypothetical protein